jgi:hypothetical protein
MESAWPSWPPGTGLRMTGCHSPPGTSKWNNVEHRLFSFISINWRGRPLTDYQVVVETIAATARPDAAWCPRPGVGIVGSCRS